MSLKPVSKPLGLPFIELQSVDSTNKYAMRLAHESMATHGMVILSHSQTAGKGQRGRIWDAEAGKNLLFSIIINPYPLDLSQLFPFSAAVALAVHQVFSSRAGEETRIKWPNDIYWRDRKAGGILIENQVQATDDSRTAWKWAVAGIGLNINQSKFSKDLPNPVSLLQITGKQHRVVELAHAICENLSSRLNQLAENGEDDIIREYNEQLYKRNEEADFKIMGKNIRATVVKVDEKGYLYLKGNKESRHAVGEVEMITTGRQ